MILKLYIEEEFAKQAAMFIEGESFDKLPIPFISEFQDITFTENLVEELDSYDLIFFVDGNNYGQFTEKSEELSELLQAKTSVVIDHHASTPDTFTYNYIDASINACAAIFSAILFDISHHSKTIAQLVIAGIMADTNKLSYVDADGIGIVEILAQALQYAGIGTRQIAEVMDTKSVEEFEVEQELTKNMVLEDNETIGKFTYSFYTLEFKEKYSSADLKAPGVFTNYFLRNVEGYLWGFVLKPKAEDIYSLSFRSSIGGVNVRILAEELFGGGGHDAAAGGRVYFDQPTTVHKAIDFVISQIETYAKEQGRLPSLQS